jgi:hypothetical protein
LNKENRHMTTTIVVNGEEIPPEEVDERLRALVRERAIRAFLGGEKAQAKIEER